MTTTATRYTVSLSNILLAAPELAAWEECELCECATPAGRDVCDECAVNLAHDGALVSVDGGDE